MLKSHEKFHSVNGKRQILIADDEIINREILREMLQDDYELLFAADGEKALKLIRENENTLSLILLDILMPNKSGLDVLKDMRADSQLSQIPVIVMTAERESEVESLELGAIDFIPKPYPPVGVIQARLRRTIELTEDRDIIQSTERDPLTGLYNREYFYRYAEQFDQYHADLVMDAVLLDINHFHMINERYGKAYGDEILKKLAGRVRAMVLEAGGFVCRREADTFMVYLPHREDYPQVMEDIMSGLLEGDAAENRVRLRMGVYPKADKTIDVEQRFDRAKMAADTVRDTFTQNIGYYDKHLHQRQLYAEQLIEEFPKAIAEKQFEVYYQPKFDIRPDTPLLASAEALVRWVHPTLGTISPGVFIPLFEENGLVRKLDSYVWRETARQIRDWKDRLGYSVPVSVNVSRIDMFDNSLPQTLETLMEDFSLTGADFLLEVTESAYTQDSLQIIRMVESLRKRGFQIEMDDFGTGYSSLHMISSLPIDALKLDMQFVRGAFSEGGNTHMLEVIIGIAAYLAVPVIAEGVETTEQVRALKRLGCDIVQGYFFSRPVPASDFEAFILQRKEVDEAKEDRIRRAAALKPLEEEARHIARRIELQGIRKETGAQIQDEPRAEQDKAEDAASPGAADAKTQTVSEGVNTSQKEGAGDLTTEGVFTHGYRSERIPDAALYEEKESAGSDRAGIPMRVISLIFFIAALLAAGALFVADMAVTRAHERMGEASDRYVEARLAASELEAASDYLTDKVRSFVVTGDVGYLQEFYKEVEEARRRDIAVENLSTLLEGVQSNAVERLNTALRLSNELISFENHAMRLVIETGNYAEKDIPSDVLAVELTDDEKQMDKAALEKRARQLVFDDNYLRYKELIRENVRLCGESLIQDSGRDLSAASDWLSFLIYLQAFLTILLLAIILGFVVLTTRLIRQPLSVMVEKMHAHEAIPPAGVRELQYVARTYNHVLAANQAAQERLSHAASHDALTGLFNRGAYDLWMENAENDHIGLILFDADDFKTINDTLGHAAGDEVLKRIANVLKASFRSSDIVCRIGGDEFAVIMTRVNSSMRALVANKIALANDMLLHPEDGTPPISLSAGVAFSDRTNSTGDIYRDADTALYRMKEAGRNGCQFY